MSVDPANPHWEERDRLVLSKAHASPALYAALALREYFPVEKVYSYCELGGISRDIPTCADAGMEASGGPLGMGLSVAVGIALGMRYKNYPWHGSTASWEMASATKGTCGRPPWPRLTITSTT